MSTSVSPAPSAKKTERHRRENTTEKAAFPTENMPQPASEVQEQVQQRAYPLS